MTEIREPLAKAEPAAPPPASMSEAEQLRLIRERQRGRNLVLGGILFGLAALFFFITIAKMQIYG